PQSRPGDGKQHTATIRPVTFKDIEALYALDQACFPPGIAYSRGELRRFLGIATAVGVLADRDGTLAGFAIGYLTRGRTAHVVTLDVGTGERRRRRGAARGLDGEHRRDRVLREARVSPPASAPRLLRSGPRRAGDGEKDQPVTRRARRESAFFEA